MKQPDVRSSIRDEEADVTYHVMAYRKLSRAEVVEAVRYFHSMKKRRTKLKPGTTITIMTIIGHNE